MKNKPYTVEECEKLATIIAKEIAKFQKDMHRDVMKKIHYDLFTPFYIKWYHKFFNKTP